MSSMYYHPQLIKLPMSPILTFQIASGQTRPIVSFFLELTIQTYYELSLDGGGGKRKIPLDTSTDHLVVRYVRK